ncbi:MAG: molybdenum cofactor biosynthesis protein MoaE [Actinobacteria bacterium]|nr:molybdenum cofactor biosynthesis protein MoaE [Actinomycetota bacterium]
MDKVFVTDQVISAAHLATLVQDNKSGAVVTFSGEVRNHDGGKDVATLTYEIHPSAQEVLASIVSEVSARFAVNDSALVNTVKEKLPIWKHQVFTDGSDQWVNFA